MNIKEASKRYGISQDTLRYYERVGPIPSVTRTAGGKRDYQEEDLRWVQLAVCMRKAGLTIETLTEYARLFRQGDETIPARLDLLTRQMKELEERRQDSDQAMERLAYKIEHYQQAMITGELTWDKKENQ